MPYDAEAILAKDDLAREAVEVPEWGGTFYARTMTGAERDAFDVEHRAASAGMANIRARLVGRCACDEHGTRIFSDEQIGALGNKSHAALDRLFGPACRLNGLSSKEVDDTRGNSSGGPSAASG